jgi:general L-amino acid transport system permease protein
MVAISDPQKDGFKISMLLYDTRYRSMTIQIIALIAILSSIGWLVNNVAQNLDALGKGLGFGFLFEPASYDINQRLLDYNSRDTHLRASLIGVLNTLVIAVLGCITATVVGVMVGVLRLSNNWIVSKIMTFYVEGFRNVPVLLWIILFMAIFIENLPVPNAFRGEDATATLKVFDSVALTNRGFYIPEPLFSNSLGNVHFLGAGSLRFDVSLDLIVFLIVLGGGLWTARRIKRRANAIQEATGDRPTTWWKRLLVIFVPLIILFYFLGLHLGYPALKGFNFTGGIHMRNSLIALWLALSLYTAAFIAETVRGGILAISKGQTEAAGALGIRPGRIMSLVVLPQALRVIIPPMISQYLNLTKNSSLAIAVGYMDITGTLGGITLNQTGREMESLMLLMAIYLTISLSISAVMNWYNNSVKLKER